MRYENKIGGDKRRQGITEYDESARAAGVAKGLNWTRVQATRLGIAESELLEAIRERAWLPEQVEKVASPYELESLPPMLDDVLPSVDRKWDAEVWRRARAKIAARKKVKRAA